MNVPTMVVDKAVAMEKLREYEAVEATRRTQADQKLKTLWKAIAKDNRPVLDLRECFSFAGLNARGEPALAIARADWNTVYCFKSPWMLGDGWQSSANTVGFSGEERWDCSKTRANILLPNDTLPGLNNVKWRSSSLRAPVPHIPPKCRPNIALSNFHVLFEVPNWEVYPTDPYLLRRIEGMLFVVVAEWDLTPLEQSLLSAMTDH